MQKRTLVTALVLSVLFTAGCATQDMKGGSVASRATKEGPNSNVFEVFHDFSGQGLTSASVNIYTKCYPPDIPVTCLPTPDAFVAVTAKDQGIDFTIRDGSTFDYPGIKFENDYFKCDRTGNKSYTCSPNTPPTEKFLKYTIKVVDAFVNDPYGFVKN